MRFVWKDTVMSSKGKVIALLAGCAVAILVIVWAIVASVSELSTVWYW